MARVKSGYIIEEFDIVVSGYGNIEDKKLTQGQAIKEFCLECQGGHAHPWRCGDGSVIPPSRPHREVEECLITNCFLWPFREGHNPRKKRAPKAT